jgi:hypothetical protein
MCPVRLAADHIDYAREILLEGRIHPPSINVMNNPDNSNYSIRFLIYQLLIPSLKIFHNMSYANHASPVAVEGGLCYRRLFQP